MLQKCFQAENMSHSITSRLWAKLWESQTIPGSPCFSHSYLSPQAALSETRDAVPFNKAHSNKSTNTFPSTRLLLLFPDVHSCTSTTCFGNPIWNCTPHFKDSWTDILGGREEKRKVPECLWDDETAGQISPNAKISPVQTVIEKYFIFPSCLV